MLQSFFISEPRFFGNILKLPPTLVQVKFVRAHIGGKENLGQPIIVQITNGNATPIVEIAIAENIEVGGIGNIIFKMDPGIIEKSKQ